MKIGCLSAHMLLKLVITAIHIEIQGICAIPI